MSQKINIEEVKEKCKGKRLYVETRLENWDDIFKLYNRFLMAFVFRGHGCADWSMSSSLERMAKRFHPNHYVYAVKGYEEDNLKEFKWKYQGYEKTIIPADKDVIEWLSIMQHYGAPTRLVDFTYSLYVALFMAMDSLVEDEDSAIWGLNQLICRDIFFQDKMELEKKCKDKDEMDCCIYEEANSVLLDIMRGSEREYTKGIYLVKPRKVNERLVHQQGLFAIQSDPNSTFEDNFFSIANNNEAVFLPFREMINNSSSYNWARPSDIALIKIVIPKEYRWDIFMSLEQMNITSETMYPGLEGLARSMNRQRYQM
ncbi:MAG: FRG domain-containing protein [Bacteroidales bacterium]|nr:FRG domain-containing protein [Bacteroidales bacterium]